VSPVDAVQSRAAVAAAAKRIPLVQVDRRVNVDSDVVSVDHGRGIQLVLEHLIGEGCCSFAFVTTAGRSSIARERLEAYIRCVRPIDRASASRVLAGDSRSPGQRGARRLAGDYCPEAVVCANDLIAVGVLQGLRGQGIRAPEDVAVTGYDDSILAGVVEPKLTTVRQPLGPLGQEAVRLVISAIESRPSETGAPAAPELVVRESSTKPGRRKDSGAGVAKHGGDAADVYASSSTAKGKKRSRARAL